MTYEEEDIGTPAAGVGSGKAPVWPTGYELIGFPAFPPFSPIGE